MSNSSASSALRCISRELENSRMGLDTLMNNGEPSFLMAQFFEDEAKAALNALDECSVGVKTSFNTQLLRCMRMIVANQVSLKQEIITNRQKIEQAEAQLKSLSSRVDQSASTTVEIPVLSVVNQYGEDSKNQTFVLNPTIQERSNDLACQTAHFGDVLANNQNLGHILINHNRTGLPLVIPQQKEHQEKEMRFPFPIIKRRSLYIDESTQTNVKWIQAQDFQPSYSQSSCLNQKRERVLNSCNTAKQDLLVLASCKNVKKSRLK